MKSRKSTKAFAHRTDELADGPTHTQRPRCAWRRAHLVCGLRLTRPANPSGTHRAPTTCWHLVWTSNKAYDTLHSSLPSRSQLCACRRGRKERKCVNSAIRSPSSRVQEEWRGTARRGLGSVAADLGPEDEAGGRRDTWGRTFLSQGTLRRREAGCKG